ncbi:MAG: PQQ-binding-like beta-propeller repeat protein [Pirellulaceae bacterium]|nr:PQQ-binding-like beta-propeller repeat protein [Pirellulaceae bacterium]
MHASSLRRRNAFRCLALSSVILTNIAISSALGSDWARFRGPNGSGVSSDTQPVPTTWSPVENLKWKVELPGPGSSAPIVVGKHVFVTCWSGYGTDRRNPGDQGKLQRHLVCLDRNTGETIWSQPVAPTLPEDEYRGSFAEHGYASHTPVSDGKRIYVYFGKTGALAFDLDGKRLWQTAIGTESDPRGWGSASSPILFGNVLIVTATAECEGLVGLDTETGKELWRQEAAGFNATWGTPVLVPVDDQRTDLVIGVPNEIWGFNPETGKLRWYCEALETDSFCSSVVALEDTVFAIEGRGGGAIAVRAGGKGEVTDSHVVWTDKHSNRIGTPLVYEGRIYFIARGIATCIDAKTGKKVFQSRLEGGAEANQSADREGGSGGGRGNAEGGGGRGGGGGGGGRRSGGGGGFGGDYASAVIADGKLYFVTRTGNMFVMNAGDKFKLLAINRVTDQREDFSATPAISNGQLFIRSSRHAYCIAFESSPAKETE